MSSNITPTARSLFTSSDASPTRNISHAAPMTAASTPRSSASQSKAPNSTSKGSLFDLTERWATLSSSMRSQAHSSAELLVQQATLTSQAEDFVKLLLLQLQVKEEERARLEAQVIQDRADFTAQAKLLSQHFTTSHHRNTALAVANEALQAEVRDLKGIIETAAGENEALQHQVALLAQEHAREREARARAEAGLHEQGAAAEEMGAELQHSRAMVEELQGAREKLQAQVRAMVKAEKELTENLKQTHGQIDEQLNMLREQLQNERQKRVQANKRKVELAQQVATLTSHLEACKDALENEIHLNQQHSHSHPHPKQASSSSPSVSGGGKAPSPGQPLSGSKQAAAGGRAALASAKASLRAATSAPKPAPSPVATTPVSAAAAPPGVGYTAAFAPPAVVSRAVTTPEVPSSSSRSHSKPLFPAYPPPPPLLAGLRREGQATSTAASSDPASSAGSVDAEDFPLATIRDVVSNVDDALDDGELEILEEKREEVRASSEPHNDLIETY